MEVSHKRRHYLLEHLLDAEGGKASLEQHLEVFNTEGSTYTPVVSCGRSDLIFMILISTTHINKSTTVIMTSIISASFSWAKNKRHERIRRYHQFVF